MDSRDIGSPSLLSCSCSSISSVLCSVSGSGKNIESSLYCRLSKKKKRNFSYPWIQVSCLKVFLHKQLRPIYDKAHRVVAQEDPFQTTPPLDAQQCRIRSLKLWLGDFLVHLVDQEPIRPVKCRQVWKTNWESYDVLVLTVFFIF